MASPRILWDLDEQLDRNKEVLLDMVAGLAPGLRVVKTVDRADYAWEIPPETKATKMQLPWKDELSKAVPSGQLTRLALHGKIRLNQVLDWIRVTQFSQLQDLEMDNVEKPVMDELVKVAIDGRLNNLLRLSLTGYSCLNTDGLLCALRPLEALSLSYKLACDGFAAISQVHGSSLRTLEFMPDDATCYDINDLPRYCPNLQEAKITMCRPSGDSRESEGYHSLNSLRKLEILDLTLWTPDFTNDEMLRADAVRLKERLTNAFIDEDLAIAIA